MRRKNKSSSNKVTNSSTRFMDLLETHENEISLKNLEPMNADELAAYWLKNSHIKRVESEIPFAPHLKLVDGSIKNRMKEDEFFLRDEELQERLRRGNTLIKLTDAPVGHNSVSEGRFLIARRGLPKFFDMRQLHLQILQGTKNKFEFTKAKSDCYFEWKTFVPKVLETLKNGSQIDVYLSEKANGENA